MCELSVLIATRRRAALLARTLESLAAMDVGTLSWELLVVDNGPDLDTRAVVQSVTTLPIRLIEEPTPGKNRSLNRALAEIHGDLIVFTDDDVVVDRHWLQQIRDGAARWPDASMFGGRILPQWPAAHKSGAHEFHAHAYAIADFDHGEGPYSSGYVYGPNMAIRGDVFQAGWRFNPAIGPDGTDRYITGSETSLTVALERNGGRAVYLPGAVVHHHIRPEQLRPEWLYGRAFRKGRADAFRKGLEGGWRSVPRSLLRTASREYLSWVRCRLRGDHAGALDHGISYWNARGQIYHCRVTTEPRLPADRLAPRFGA